MQKTSEPHIVGIRFQKVGKIYHFNASAWREIQVGDFAIVETSRGNQLGEVIQIIQNPTPPPEGAWKPIQRIATPRDLVLRQLWQKKELEATITCRAKAAELNTPGVKIITAEFSFDGSRLAFLFSTEAETKIELRSLRSAMQRIYPRSIVEMRQIGPRDVAKLLGGMGACGIDNRCCSKFLTDFSPISIKMAKEQGISLTPSEITGMCGRLRCCLVYEYEQYVEARKQMPKRGKRVVTPQGEGKVIDVYPLRQAVVVLLDKGTQLEFHQDTIQPWEELEALRKKSQEPCAKHGDGPCDCGKDAGITPGAEAPDQAAGIAEKPASGKPASEKIAPTPSRPKQQSGPASEGARKKKKKKKSYD